MTRWVCDRCGLHNVGGHFCGLCGSRPGKTPEDIAAGLHDALRARGWPVKSYSTRELRTLVSLLRRAFPAPRFPSAEVIT